MWQVEAFIHSLFHTLQVKRKQWLMNKPRRPDVKYGTSQYVLVNSAFNIFQPSLSVPEASPPLISRTYVFKCIVLSKL